MATNKVELFLEKFEENVALEEFYFDQVDRESFVQVLREQQELLPELLREMNRLPIGNLLWKRLRIVADRRSLQEQKVAASLGEMSRNLGRLRQSARRLQDWQKAWHSPVRSGSELSETYA